MRADSVLHHANCILDGEDVNACVNDILNWMMGNGASIVEKMKPPAQIPQKTPHLNQHEAMKERKLTSAHYC